MEQEISDWIKQRRGVVQIALEGATMAIADDQYTRKRVIDTIAAVWIACVWSAFNEPDCEEIVDQHEVVIEKLNRCHSFMMALRSIHRAAGVKLPDDVLIRMTGLGELAQELLEFSHGPALMILHHLSQRAGHTVSNPDYMLVQLWNDKIA